MKIPKKFKLFGTTYTVVFDDERLEHEDSYGLHEAPQTLITLAKAYRGVKYSDDFVIDSFYHEKAHALLYSMGEFKLNKNEKFIEVLGKLLRQSDETAEF